MSNNMAKIAEARKTVEQLKLEVNIDRMKVRGAGGEEGGGSGAGVWTRRCWEWSPWEDSLRNGAGARAGGVVTRGRAGSGEGLGAGPGKRRGLGRRTVITRAPAGVAGGGRAPGLLRDARQRRPAGDAGTRHREPLPRQAPLLRPALSLPDRLPSPAKVWIQ